MAQNRPGRTLKLSVSLSKEDVTTLRKLAKESYGGNLSAAFAAAAKIVRQREARRRLVDLLGGPTLPPEKAAEVDAEIEGASRRARRRSRRTKAA